MSFLRASRRATPWLREVRGYYSIVAKLEKTCRSIQPAVAAWAASEMKTCSRYVAVVLDQNLSLDLDTRAAVRSFKLAAGLVVPAGAPLFPFLPSLFQQIS